MLRLPAPTMTAQVWVGPKLAPRFLPPLSPAARSSPGAAGPWRRWQGAAFQAPRPAPSTRPYRCRPVTGEAGAQASRITPSAVQTGSRGALTARASHSRARPLSPVSVSTSSAIRISALRVGRLGQHRRQHFAGASKIRGRRSRRAPRRAGPRRPAGACGRASRRASAGRRRNRRSARARRRRQPRDAARPATSPQARGWRGGRRPAAREAGRRRRQPARGRARAHALRAPRGEPNRDGPAPSASALAVSTTARWRRAVRLSRMLPSTAPGQRAERSLPVGRGGLVAEQRRAPPRRRKALRSRAVSAICRAASCSPSRSASM